MVVENNETGSLRLTGLNLLLQEVLVPFCFHTFMPMKRNISFAGFQLSRAVFGLCYVILVLVGSLFFFYLVAYSSSYHEKAINALYELA